jgi:hypothetical protein
LRTRDPRGQLADALWSGLDELDEQEQLGRVQAGGGPWRAQAADQAVQRQNQL